MTDLFGTDLPIEGGKGGEFAWRDGPFLSALKAGHWIVLDEVSHFLAFVYSPICCLLRPIDLLIFSKMHNFSLTSFEMLKYLLDAVMFFCDFFSAFLFVFMELN